MGWVFLSPNTITFVFLIDLLGKQHWSLHLDDPESNPSSIGVDKPRNVWFLFFSSLCNLFCWVLYVYLLITHVYLSPLALYKACLRICVGDCLRFLLYVRDLSFARDRLLRFLPRMIICQFLNSRNEFRSNIHYRVSELNASALVKYARNRYGGDAVDFYVVEICQEWILR